MALIHDDPARFGLEGDIAHPTVEFQIADEILELAQSLAEHIKENPEAEEVLRATSGALARVVERYWGDAAGWGLEVEARPEPKPKRIGVPFKKVTR